MVLKPFFFFLLFCTIREPGASDLFVFITFFFSLLFLHPVRECRRFYLKPHGIRSLQLLTLNLNQIEANKG